MPKSRWTRYGISPIGTTLRPANDEDGITPDMVTPIAPNASHGRRAVNPATPFPFPNCYHWIDNRTSVRIKVRPEDYDHARVVRLDSREHIALGKSFADDYVRIAENRRRRREEAASKSALSPCSNDSKSGSESEPGSTSDSDSDSDSESSKHDEQRSCASSGLASSYATTVDSVLKEDIFGWDPDPNVGRIPLVDLWFELDEHLTADTIPSPVGLYEEKRTIQSYVPIFCLSQSCCLLMSPTVGSSSVRARGEGVHSSHYHLHRRTRSGPRSRCRPKHDRGPRLSSSAARIGKVWSTGKRVCAPAPAAADACLTLHAYADAHISHAKEPNGRWQALRRARSFVRKMFCLG